MTTRTKAGGLLIGAVLLLTIPYLIVFGIGSVWMWQHGLMWCWALGTGVPTLLGLAMAEWARRLIFPPTDPNRQPSPGVSAAERSARLAVQEISRRLQTQDPAFDQPDVLERVLRDVLSEVLDTVARQYHPQVDRPVLEVPVVHIAAVVELVARDFRQTFSEKVPWGNTMTPGRLLRWKQKGKLAWQAGAYLWQLNRVRRLIMRPGTAIVQEVQDRWGTNLAAKSAAGVKQWAIDYCVTKAGDYAIQLYSGAFVLDDEYRSRISAPGEGIPFNQEPLQVLMVGQVKAGKSSLINALLGDVRAPVDTLPATDSVDLYECQPEGLPRLILRDTPGYGAADDDEEPFTRLGEEIQQCDLLVMVCTACSAAREADRALLQETREFYRTHPRRIMPPVVYVLTHADRIPEHLASEAAAAVASDLGVPVAQIVAMCARWDHLANREGVLAAIGEKQSEAERLKCARCIRQIRKEQDEDKIPGQILGGLRMTGGWAVGRK